nr:MAG TPA: hypothetical protein [Caudoviricetes sp.]
MIFSLFIHSQTLQPGYHSLLIIYTQIQTCFFALS